MIAEDKHKTTDWRTMEAGRDLDRVIAERLGYHVKAATMYAPSGTLLGGNYRVHIGVIPETIEAIDECWEFYTPCFSADINIALTLWEHEPARVQITSLSEHGYHVSAHGDKGLAIWERWDLPLEQVAEHVSKAWLAWREMFDRYEGRP